MKEASFWDQVAGVYDLFARFLNQKVHKELRYIIEKRITGTDEVLSFYDYAFERGYLLDGKGSQQEKGVMSDMREINGKQAKVRLTENGISVFYKKETLVIPDSILGRRLTDENKNELLQGKIVLVGKEKDNIFLQVDRELNAVIVCTNKELAVPNVIGRGMDYLS